VPARHLKWPFPAPMADALQQIAWWDWDHAALGAALPDIRTLDSDGFIEKCR
jgi:hypothetical protein